MQEGGAPRDPAGQSMALVAPLSPAPREIALQGARGGQYLLAKAGSPPGGAGPSES